MERPTMKRKCTFKNMFKVFKGTFFIVAWIFVIFVYVSMLIMTPIHTYLFPGTVCPYECTGHCKEILDDKASFEIKCVFDQTRGHYNYTLDSSNVIVGNNYDIYAKCEIDQHYNLHFVDEFSLNYYYYQDEHTSNMIVFYSIILPFILAVGCAPFIFILCIMCVCCDIDENKNSDLESGIDKTTENKVV